MQVSIDIDDDVVLERLAKLGLKPTEQNIASYLNALERECELFGFEEVCGNVFDSADEQIETDGIKQFKPYKPAKVIEVRQGGKTKFEIKGKCTNVSKEAFRAMLHATAVVLEYHNKTPPWHTIKVELVQKKQAKKKLGRCRKVDSAAAGWANRFEGKIAIANWKQFDELFTIVIHELIHIYFPWGDNECEALTCTLTNRLKPTIAEVYETLVDDVYSRAAFLAHTKMSYKPKGEDGYRDEQWNDPEVSDVYKKKYKRQGRFKEGSKRQKKWLRSGPNLFDDLVKKSC